MKTRITFGTMAAMATLAIGLLGAGVANASNPCTAGCKSTKSVGMKGCRAEYPCATQHSACKKACRQEFPSGLDRSLCVTECDRDKEECKDERATCAYDCGISFYECRKDCVEKGFEVGN